jgi:hypothetical protein
MESAYAEALVVAAIFAVTVIVSCGVLITVSRRGAAGALERNRRAGIRTPATLRSDHAWGAGHRAAARYTPLYAIAAIGISAALFAFALRGRLLAVIVGGIGGMFVIVAMSILTAVVASRAAKAADDGTGERVDYSKLPTANVLSPRVARAVSWAGAALAWAATVLVLFGISYGYFLSIHHQLPPNGVFGFRDAVTFSCLPAWYAGQQAGFSWVFFGYGPFLVLNSVLCVAAAVKRRPPTDIVILSMATVFLAGGAMLIAGIHAGNVARAVPC